MAPITANEIVIVESLPPQEAFRTGEELCRQLSSETQLPVTFRKPVRATELFHVIQDMTRQASEMPWAPVVQLEIHGTSSKSGLVVASGEFIAWQRFAAELRELNVATRNSLLVVLGVCSGLYLSTAAAVSPFEPAPFYGLIGPDRSVNSFVMYHGFLAFYRELLSSGDIAKAVDQLRLRNLPEYSGLDTAMLFRRGMEVYDRTLLQGEGLARRVKKVMRKVPPSEIARYGGRNKARKAFAQKLRDISALERDGYYQHFIMADIYPENAQRFPPLGAA